MKKPKEGKAVKPSGRPNSIPDSERGRFEALCRLKPTLEDAAAFFKCDTNTILLTCQRWGFKDFKDFRAQNFVHTKLELIRSAIAKSKHDTKMHIFTLKNLSNWKERTETLEHPKNMNKSALREEINSLLEQLGDDDQD